MNSRKLEILVGFFVALGIAAFALLAFKVANAGISGNGETYQLNAKFENIGSLKARAPIKVGGLLWGVSSLSPFILKSLFLWLTWLLMRTIYVSFRTRHQSLF